MTHKKHNKDTNPDELEKTKQELEKITELAKRTMADLENLKRRHAEERSQITEMANMDLISSLLPALENLERAKRHMPPDASEWYKGIEMSINQLKKVFHDFGLKEIEASGQPFNPNLHEALSQGPGPKDLVIEELEKGYMLGTRVLKTAKVKVGNGEKG
ncbi:MAG: nucleotide exchange factor GrpE [Candidatus Peregrinibacteria bacterium]